MSFMQQEITGLQTWFEIDGANGITFLPAANFPELFQAKDSEGEWLLAVFEDYVEGEVWTVETRLGFGARMSASGYLDCTEWAVFDTWQEAKEYLDEEYGDPEE